MALLIFIQVVMTAALIGFVVAPRARSHRVVFAETPDMPKPFGYRMSWLAIRCEDTAAVAAALGLDELRPANWNSGIGTIYDSQLSDSYVFVTPPLKGWTFVAGEALPHRLGRSFADKLMPVLTELADTFSDVQYYAAFPSIDYFAWVRLHKARLVRAFVIGDDGVIWNHGRLTAEEKTLGLKLYDLRGIKNRKGDAGGAIVLYPTEEKVLRLARSWGLDPLQLDKIKVAPSSGLIARVPASWRPQRLKREAA